MLPGNVLKLQLCCVRLDAACTVDMRQMLPSVAEVYVLVIAASLRRTSQTK